MFCISPSPPMKGVHRTWKTADPSKFLEFTNIKEGYMNVEAVKCFFFNVYAYCILKLLFVYSGIIFNKLMRNIVCIRYVY